MGYTKEYMLGFCEFWFAVIGVFIIVQSLSNNGLGVVSPFARDWRQYWLDNMQNKISILYKWGVGKDLLTG